jgi:alpha-tubulin suppressor-like RCC1 family protein
MQIVSGDSQSAVVGTELPDPLIVRVVDSSGAPVSGQIVNFVVVAGGGSVFAGSAISNDSGSARERWTLGIHIADSQRVEARAVDNVTGARLTFAVFEATALAGPPDSIHMIAGDSQVSVLGDPQPDSLAVRISDQYGNPVFGDSVVWSAGPGNGTFSPAHSVTDAAGIARSLWTIDSAQSTDTATATVLGDSLSVVFTATGAFPFTFIAGGDAHTCGLGRDGSAYCWGVNIHGELGTGDTIPSSVPRKVTGALTFVSLAVGDETACGLASDHSAYCWGHNDAGQLGSGGGGTRSTQPVPVAGGLFFLGLTSGGTHTCGITVDSLAYCWGGNAGGELGTGDSVSSNVPVPVSGGIAFTAISTSSTHTCALTAGGVAYCWGDNTSGELGIDTTSAAYPTPVSVLGGSTFTQISAGGFFTCGVSGGAGFCWGSNYYGTLGTGQPRATGDTALPTPMVGGHTFQEILSGAGHACAVGGDHTTYCWGDNEFAELGSGAVGAQINAVPLPVSAGQEFVAVAAAKGEFTCALEANGIAYCWGQNNWGNTGDGTPHDGSTEVIVTTPTRVVNP